MKTRMSYARALTACGLLVGGVLPAITQDMRPNDVNDNIQNNGQQALVRARTELVSLTLTATDRDGRPVSGLEAHDIDVFEDNVKQKIEHYTPIDSPLSLGVIFDLSGSMELTLESAKNALKSFLESRHPDDEIFLMGFHKRAELVEEFSDGERLMQRLNRISAQGPTALYDGVYLGVEKLLQGRHSRRALLVLSDGQDNASRYDLNRLRERVKEADIQLYCIGIGDKNAGNKSEQREAQRGQMILDELAALTGGRAFFPVSAAGLDGATSQIAVELRRQFSLSFAPTNQTRDGRWRKIKVRLSPALKDEKISLRTRAGYYTSP